MNIAPIPAVSLLLDSARGIYIPQNFVEAFNAVDWHVSMDDRGILANGPETEFYWEAWETVLNNAYYEKDGRRWTLHQDGDLWALCPDLMTDEEKRNFGFDED